MATGCTDFVYRIIALSKAAERPSFAAATAGNGTILVTRFSEGSPTALHVNGALFLHTTTPIRPAVREKIGFLFGIAGASGSGKTYSALCLAKGIANGTGKIAVIDTEAGRELHYAPKPGIPLSEQSDASDLLPARRGEVKVRQEREGENRDRPCRVSASLRKGIHVRVAGFDDASSGNSRTRLTATGRIKRRVTIRRMVSQSPERLSPRAADPDVRGYGQYDLVLTLA